MILLNWSGGYDSTYLLWKSLEEKENLLVHHCKLKSNQFREKAETDAIEKMRKWFKKNGYKFKYIETEFSFFYPGMRIYDFAVLAFLSAMIIDSKAGEDINKILLPVNSRDIRTGYFEPYFYEYYKTGGIYPKGEKRKITIEKPLIKKDKSEYNTPEDLKKLCWSCTTPIYKDNKILECKKCTNCVKNKEYNLLKI